MWFLLVRAALTGIFGSAFGKWFLSTRMGRWVQIKLDTFMEYLAVKHDIKIAKREEKWMSDFPHIAEIIDKLQNEVSELRTEIERLKKEK